MDPLMQPGFLLSFSAWLLLQLLNQPEHSRFESTGDNSDEESDDPFAALVGSFIGPVQDAHSLLNVGLNNYRFCTLLPMVDDDVGF